MNSDPTGPRPARLYSPTQELADLTAEPRCTVGLLTWNADRAVIACIESLYAQTEAPLEMIYIDNASTDSTPERVAGVFPEFPRGWVNAHNYGFCDGHNQAIKACRTRYYLALNQDVALDPEYIRRLCDWMDHDDRLAMASGVMIGENGSIASAGLVFPRTHYPYDLMRGLEPRLAGRKARRRAGVNGAAMLLRVEACRAVSEPAGEVFASDFFAYHEEVDLALRLARGEWACGIDPTVRGMHKEFSSGGLRRPEIQRKFIVNHWMLALRNESWGMILRDLPYILKGELACWSKHYRAAPGVFFAALGEAFHRLGSARRFYHALEKRFGNSRTRVQWLKREALVQLRESELVAQDADRNGGKSTQ